MNKSTTKEYKKSPEKKLLSLAAEIAEAKEVQIPRLLIKLDGILGSYEVGTPQLKGLKEAIYEYDLLEMLLTALKQDFGKMPEGWKSASTLANILSQCCIGLDVAEVDDFEGRFLPLVLEQQLLLARKIQGRYVKTSDVLEDTKNDLLLNFRGVLDAICVLYSGHDFLCKSFVASPVMMQLLLNDDVKTCVVSMSALQSVVRLRPTVMKEVGDKIFQQYMDEFIYKLAATSNMDIANAGARTVLVICDAYKETVEYMCTRYKGLRLLLQRWQGKGFDRDLNRLLILLEAGTHQQGEMIRLHEAARVIQAHWRSHFTRRKLSTAQRAVANFQRTYRMRKEKERMDREDQRRQNELKHWLLLERKKTMRELRYRQLSAIQLMPASAVERHLAEEQRSAAVCIQRHWKGYRVRAGIQTRRSLVQRIRAAVTIQRAVRRWLEGIHRRRKEPPNWQRPPGLTDERRVELLEKIQHHRENHEPQTVGAEKRAELHYRVQALLKNHAIGSKRRRQLEMHRQALIGRLSTDAQLLIPCPKLTEVSTGDLVNFVSHSLPVATAARHQHNLEMRRLRQPWWRRLGDDEDSIEMAPGVLGTHKDQTLADWKVF